MSDTGDTESTEGVTHQSDLQDKSHPNPSPPDVSHILGEEGSSCGTTSLDSLFNKQQSSFPII